MMTADAKGTKADLERLGREYGEAVLEALKIEAEAILADSKRECPVDTGYLRNSGTVRDIKDGSEVGYSAEYAPYVHEDMEASHPTGKAKFLEDPFDRRKGSLRPNVLRHLQRRIR